ncbi:MAG: DUF1501 domain-containing protein [Planctomycetia bacterium]|nr:DUF1501 domain-containing protein [Planctomycetia bacterium]
MQKPVSPLGLSFGTSTPITRRNCLQIGAAGIAGITLPNMLRAEAKTGGKRHKSLIHIVLRGGPSQLDTFDLKPHAPREIRGEFKPIQTVIPGLQICEHMPMLAKIADKFSVIRSLVGSEGRHGSWQMTHGLANAERTRVAGGSPGIGPVLAKLHGPVNRSIPPFISLSGKKVDPVWYNNPGQPGCLGPAFAAFDPSIAPQDRSATDNLERRVGNMKLHADISQERFRDRRQLLRAFDELRRDIDQSGVFEGADAYTQQAYEILTSGRLLEALDVEREDPRVRARYGKALPLQTHTTFTPYNSVTNPDYLLLARRLIEAGARNVTFTFGWWDWHGMNTLYKQNCFDEGRRYIPALDQALSALLEDLTERGLIDDVTILVWGEFGRTPVISNSAGRDHWPNVACGLLAGGGLRTGCVIGATDSRGGEAAKRPIHFQDVYATVYHALGIDVRHTTYKDHNGRPQYLIDNDKYGLIRELV